MRRVLLDELAGHYRENWQMAFLSGPRQVGKTTLARALTDLFPGSEYLNWDNQAHRAVILDGPEAIASRLGLDRLLPSPPLARLARGATLPGGPARPDPHTGARPSGDAGRTAAQPSGSTHQLQLLGQERPGVGRYRKTLDLDAGGALLLLRGEALAPERDAGAAQGTQILPMGLVASALLKSVHWWTETGQGDFGLHFVRDKQKHEVDFLVTRDQQPWFLVEVKASEKASLSEALSYLQRQTGAAHAFQVAMDGEFVALDCFAQQAPIIVPARTLLAQLA